MSKTLPKIQRNAYHIIFFNVAQLLGYSIYSKTIDSKKFELSDDETQTVVGTSYINHISMCLTASGYECNVYFMWTLRRNTVIAVINLIF